MAQNARKAEKAKTIISTEALGKAGLVDESDIASLKAVEDNFSIRIPPHAVSQMQLAERDDPVYAQYVPDRRELDFGDHELEDPIGDGTFEKEKGITHRYPDRLLFKPTHTCQVYCRFCFRREKVGHPEATLNRVETEAALSYIRTHEDIWEVILSGGDPLVLSDRRIGALMEALGEIDHIGIIRFHTRAPLVAPERVSPDLINALKRAGKTVLMVIHVNHPQELTNEVRSALSRLADAGIPLYAQTVLLKGVNDDAATLERLFRMLVSNRVKPYYLHHLDKAKGVGHFRVSIARGQAIMRELRGRVSGICQPTYVLDIPGGHGKVPIGPVYLEGPDDGYYQVTDYLGETHDYYEER